MKSFKELISIKMREKGQESTRKSALLTCQDVALDVDIDSQGFVEDNIKSTMEHVVLDALRIYEFSREKDGFFKVYNSGHFLENDTILSHTASLSEVLLQSLMGEDIVVNKLNLNQGKVGKKQMALVLGKPNVNGEVLLGNTLIKPEISYVLKSLYTKSDINLLQLNFLSVLAMYKKQARLETLDQKLIFKMHGFHALFTQPKNDEEEAIAIANSQRIADNVKQVLQSNAAIIDAKDNIGLTSGDSNRFKVDLTSNYLEIARITGIPVSRLTGQAPTGLNATGEYDYQNYLDLLTAFRKLYIDPLLDIMGLQYKKASKENMQKYMDYVQLCKTANITLPESFVKNIQTMPEDFKFF